MLLLISLVFCNTICFADEIKAEENVEKITLTEESTDAQGAEDAEALEEEGEYFTVSSRISNSVLYGAKADYESGYSGTLVANVGYSLPKSITATMDGEMFTSFLYNSTNGKITVASNLISGELIFYGSSEASIEKTNILALSAIKNGKAVIVDSSRLSELIIQIFPDDGYVYPSNVLITSGAKIINSFKYDANTGTLKVSSTQVKHMTIVSMCPRDKSAPKTINEDAAPNKKL